jgi:SET family sugar efflux transporter-like MFS transporter
MFLSGVATSAAAPQIALFLVNDLGASLPTAGLYYLTSLTAPVAGYLVGRRSDRTGARLGLFRLCALLGFVGWVAVAFSTQVWVPFVISALVLAFAGGAASQLFAAVHDQIAAEFPGRERDGDGVVAIIRMALTAGWVVGPALGSWFAAEFGLRAMLVATAVCGLCQIIPLGRLRTNPPEHRVAHDTVTRTTPGFRVMLPLLAFTGLYVLVYAGESVKYGFLPIYMTEGLHLAPGVSGAVIGIQPLVELILMPFSVIVGRRLGMMRLMAVGAVFGVAANLCFALTGTTVGMFAGQILMGGVWGIFAALGIITAQRLLPSAVATASAIFLTSTAVSSALGGLTGAVGVSVLGLPHVFLIPALFGLIATVGLALMARTHPMTQ